MRQHLSQQRPEKIVHTGIGIAVQDAIFQDPKPPIDEIIGGSLDGGVGAGETGPEFSVSLPILLVVLGDLVEAFPTQFRLEFCTLHLENVFFSDGAQFLDSSEELKAVISVLAAAHAEGSGLDAAVQLLDNVEEAQEVLDLHVGDGLDLSGALVDHESDACGVDTGGRKHHLDEPLVALGVLRFSDAEGNGDAGVEVIHKQQREMG